MRIVVASILIGVLVSFVAMLSVDILLPWRDAVNVADASRDQLASLAPMALDDKVRSGEIKLKSVSGAEKVVYLVTHNPSSFGWSWANFFVPSTIAAGLALLLSRRRNGA